MLYLHIALVVAILIFIAGQTMQYADGIRPSVWSDLGCAIFFGLAWPLVAIMVLMFIAFLIAFLAFELIPAKQES